MKVIITSEFRKRLRDFIVSQLKGAAIKAALKAVLGSAAGAGIQAWLVKFIVTEFFEEVAEPVVRSVLVEAGYRLDKVNGKIEVKHLREANDAEAHDRAVDDILS